MKESWWFPLKPRPPLICKGVHVPSVIPPGCRSSSEALPTDAARSVLHDKEVSPVSQAALASLLVVPIQYWCWVTRGAEGQPVYLMRGALKYLKKEHGAVRAPLTHSCAGPWQLWRSLTHVGVGMKRVLSAVWRSFTSGLPPKSGIWVHFLFAKEYLSAPDMKSDIRRDLSPS